MSQEASFIEALRALATHPAARGLADDAALFEGLVVTHDMLAQGVHYLPSDPPEDVAWKLLAVNLSDLAAKGAVPLAVLMGYCLSGSTEWDARFIAGLKTALDTFNVALIGGDTVSLLAGAPPTLNLTAIGRAGAVTPSRSGARIGHNLFVTGVIGDAGLGLKVARDLLEQGLLELGQTESNTLLAAYRRPTPQLAAGLALAPIVSAMMDVSDGLLVDAQRMALASGVGLSIDMDAVPLSAEAMALAGNDRAARLAAATAGDDYQLLFTSGTPLPTLPCRVTRIGRLVEGIGIRLHDANGDISLPATLGWEH